MSIGRDEIARIITGRVKPWGTKVTVVLEHVQTVLRDRGHEPLPLEEGIELISSLVAASHLRSDGDVFDWRTSHVFPA